MRWTRDGNSAQQLDEEVAIAILYQVLNGLSNYHKEGRIHRNLRSSTLLLDLDGNIGLEMSLAASNENWDRQKTRNTFVGDPGWMAPEMQNKKRNEKKR
jgi:serine/threonine protein kinase